MTNHLIASDSGINEAATNKFPGSTVTVGSAASGAGDNREIPVDEGGELLGGMFGLHEGYIEGYVSRKLES